MFTGAILAGEKKDEEKPQKKIKANVVFGLDLSQGNTIAFGVNAGLNINWEFEQKTEINFSSSINYLETDGEKKADKMNFQVLLDHFLMKKTTFFFTGQTLKKSGPGNRFQVRNRGRF